MFPKTPQIPLPPVLPMPPRLYPQKHAMHAIITILTAGFYLPIWALIAYGVANNNKKKQIEYSFAMVEYEERMAVYREFQNGLRGRPYGY